MAKPSYDLEQRSKKVQKIKQLSQNTKKISKNKQIACLCSKFTSHVLFIDFSAAPHGQPRGRVHSPDTDPLLGPGRPGADDSIMSTIFNP